jgi:hypothetical protein
MRLRQLFENRGKTAVAAFGRFNPPTIGHEKLVDKLKSHAGDHYLFLSQTQKPKDNPLPFNIKEQFIKAAFPDINVGHATVRTPIDMLKMLEKLGYTDIIYVAGSDRVDSFDALFNNYNGKEYNFNSIKVVSAGERDPDAEGAEGMSASKMRAAAAAGNEEAFASGLPTRLQPDWENVYSAVRTGMGVKELEPETESVTESQQLNEAFPLLIPALATALRIGSPAVMRLITSQGAKTVAKSVAKNTGKAAAITGKAVVKNPGKSLMAVGAYEVWDSVSDALDWLEELDLSEELMKPLAEVMVKYGLPTGAVIAALYGGKKLYDYIAANDDPSEEEIRLALGKELGLEQG